MTTIDEMVDESTAVRRSYTVNVAAFATLGLLLALTGLGGIVARAVLEQRRELAIRAAIGTGSASLAALVARQGIAPAIAGCAASLAFAGDYIVACALRDHPHSTAMVAVPTLGRYHAHIVLDRSRLTLQLDLAVSVQLRVRRSKQRNPHVERHANGLVAGDGVVLSRTWTFAAQHCFGTIQLRGHLANDGEALIGELEYVDGCADHSTKTGTFAIRK
jgi:hypothetical protein